MIRALEPLVGHAAIVHMKEFIASLLLRLILLPISVLLVTPYILLGAVFSKEGSYSANVKNGYRNVYHFWVNMI